MPTYEYVCTTCDNHWEEVQKISEDALEVCPKCGKNTAKRQISGGNFILKGGGWYADLYSSSPKPKSGGDGESKGSATKSESKSEGSSAAGASKSEAASPAASPGASSGSGSSGSGGGGSSGSGGGGSSGSGGGSGSSTP